jgi:beta-lactamase superfamily II metal-dependent hydrolase
MNIPKEVPLSADFTFHNVGQGLFYSGRIDDFNFVYDCGSANNLIPSKSLKDGIDDYYIRNKPKQINLLVLSHFDNDHINGIQYLFSKISKIDSVIIPYLNPLQRLFYVASQYKSFNDSYSLILDPIKYFNDKNVNKIYLLPEGTASNGFISNFNDDNLPNLFFPEIDNSRSNVIYKENPDWLNYQNISIINQCKSGRKANYYWEFYFYNPHFTVSNLAIFEKYLKLAFNDKTYPQIINDILSDNIIAAKLSGVYADFCKEIKIKINDTSILMYHAPILEKKNLNGQILTGDITLSDSFLSLFQSHFNDYIDNIFVFQVPHHGSISSWNKKVTSIFYNSHCFIASGKHNGWKHPNSKIIDQLENESKVFLNCADKSINLNINDIQIKSKKILRHKKLSRILGLDPKEDFSKEELGTGNISNLVLEDICDYLNYLSEAEIEKYIKIIIPVLNLIFIERPECFVQFLSFINKNKTLISENDGDFFERIGWLLNVHDMGIM